MDEQQLLTISQQVANVLDKAIGATASYILITGLDEGEGLNIYANLDASSMIHLLLDVTQDIKEQDSNVTVN